MKCDHIRTRAQGDTPFFPNMLNNGNVEVCLKEDVDAAIEEMKEEILNLKAKNIELQSFYDLHGSVDNYIDKLKAENERLKGCEIWMKQHFYCEEVIACESAKRRQLQRALWLDRARNADSMYRIFYFVPPSYLGEPLNILGYSNTTKGRQRMLSADKWKKIWLKVWRKCLKKAEEYK